MARTDPVLRARSRLANATKAGDPAAITTARRDLTTAKAERAIREALAAPHPPTPEQLGHLAALLVVKK